MDHESAGEARPPKRGRSRHVVRGGVEAADESDESDGFSSSPRSESDACESPRSSKSSTAQTSTGESRGGVGWTVALRGVPSSDDDSSESTSSGLPPGSRLPALLYLYKHAWKALGRRGGAGEGSEARSRSLGSPRGSIWWTSRPVLEALVRGAGLDESSTRDLYSTKCFLKSPGPPLDTSGAGWKRSSVGLSGLSCVMATMADTTAVREGKVETKEGSIEYRVFAKYNSRSGKLDGYTLKYNFKKCKQAPSRWIPRGEGVPSHNVVEAQLQKLHGAPAAAAPAPPGVVRELPGPPARKPPVAHVPDQRFHSSREPSFNDVYMVESRGQRAPLRDSSSDSDDSVEASPKKRHKTKQRRLEDEMAEDSDDAVDPAQTRRCGEPAEHEENTTAERPGQGVLGSFAVAVNYRNVEAALPNLAPATKGRIKKGFDLMNELVRKQKAGESDSESDSGDDDGAKERLSTSAKVNISRDVDPVIKALFYAGAGDLERTKLILNRLLEHPLLKGWRDDVPTQIVQNINALVKCEALETGGTRKRHIQVALDHLSTFVATDSSKKKRFVRQIALLTGLPGEAISRGGEERAHVLEHGLRNRDRVVRYDTRDTDWIRDLCHEHEISRLDTFARRTVKVTCDDDSIEYHEPRTLMMTREDAVEYILNSEQCKAWKASHKRKDGSELTLSRSFVRQSLCPCLKDPDWRECADPIKTGLTAPAPESCVLGPWRDHHGCDAGF